ncbi:DNA-directed RNA polymerase subunit A' [Candidatus Woesearchaeota archaeon CG10_big_fil_rev_8_21_14_0_10_44_13]|nr:MAG: DNA-directed RNA polymerase subunit A' [Candidatus Woesearchaeota archaeon CG10_big_fil_rev_8_21_14_0_10_44_13]
MAERERFTYKQVSSVVFGMLSPKMIKGMASAKIVTPELYDKEGYPVDGGLMDIRLGVIDPGLKCKTCGSKLKECIGHFGYIELARPILHINFVGLTLDILRCTCKECGKILIPENKISKYSSQLQEIERDSGLDEKRKRIKEIITTLKTVNKCPYCRAKQQKIVLEKPYTFMEGEKKLSPIEVRTRLEKVSDEDCKMFGINPAVARPEWAILTIMPIPPVTMRPSITLESGERSEDDLTHKLGDIVRINQRLFENINAGAPEIIIEDLWDLLQYHITTFFDNDIAQLPPARHRSGQPLKTISERIKSKEGRIRHNLAGKRTNFSSRTVISPDPMININEVGVPMIVAMKLTVPERVNEWNFEYLKEFVKRGPKKYPGCNYLTRPDGKKKKITDETHEQIIEELQPGYIVERHLMDGDVVIFNRQPSLHRMSMMTHRVRVLGGKTFRLNPAVCHPYNADFDGDEMNLHVPQNEEARAEAEILMAVETQLISPRYGLSIIGCVQDGISGNYILTKESEFTREEAVQILAQVGVDDFSELPNKKTITGKEVFSMLIPKDFSFVGRAKSCPTKSKPCKDCPRWKNDRCESDSYVYIKDGKLLSGVMDSANLGHGSGFLLRNLHKRYGQYATIDLLNKISKLGVYTLLKRGFSVAISDVDLPEDSVKKIQEILNNAEEEVSRLIDSFHKKELEAFPGKTTLETLELKILGALNRARNETGDVVAANVSTKTGAYIMATSGSRGTTINLAQMAACVGQQAMRGKRIDIGFTERSLPTFRKNDLSPSARGFIRHGFKSGMSPNEFFFASMTGRDSLMDTALRTPKSGYLYRRLANSLQDLKVEYDTTVRDASRKIIQFAYGEDGIDVSKSEGGKIDIKRIIDDVVKSR